MEDWKSLIDQAMQQESTDLIGAHTTYGGAVRSALSNAQLLLGDLEAAQIMESIYGALVAYSQQVMIRMRAEDPEIGGVDHAFRAGQAYGVSCVLNHLIDQLTDVAAFTNLQTLDVITEIEARCGCPVWSSNLVLGWHMMQQAHLVPQSKYLASLLQS